MRLSRAALAGAIIASSAILSGCVTPIEYAPIGQDARGFGYSDLQNADGSYMVRVVASSPEQAHEFWDRRATEICGSANFRKNIFRAEIPVVTTTGYSPGPNGYGGSYTEAVYGALIMEGYLHCEGEAAAPPETTEAAATPAP